MPHEAPPIPPRLTPRQSEVARLLANTGLSYKEIAVHLDICDGTVRKHVENVYRRIGVHSRMELVTTMNSKSTRE